MFGRIDIEDAILGGVFTLASLASTGLFTVTFLHNNTDLTAAVWSSGETTVSFAFLLSLASIAGAYATNRVGGNRRMNVDTDLADILTMKASYETYIAGGTLIIVIINGLNIMGAHEIITGSLGIGLAVVAVQMAGYYVFSYLG